jgi:transposase InsO family protein
VGNFRPATGDFNIGRDNLSDCANVFELENIISQYILHYNNARPHSALNGKTPAMVYLNKNTI